MDEAVWDVTVFTKNRERLIGGGIAEQLLLKVVEQARSRQLLSEEHFTVRTYSALATVAFQGKPFHRSGATKPRPHLQWLPTTDHGRGCPVVQEERCGRLSALLFRPFADREPERVDRRRDGDPGEQDGGGGGGLGVAGWLNRCPTSTVGADKGYQQEQFIEGLRARKVVPHVAEYEPNPTWPNWLTEAERSSPGFAISQSKRKLVEKVFGWAKQDRAVRQVKMRGKQRVEWMFRLSPLHTICCACKVDPVV